MGVNKKPHSSITEHLIKEGHVVDADESFKILYHARHRSLLKFYEAVAIKRLKPELNVQKEPMYNLKLPLYN